jgi:hypothetical protein
MPACGLQIYTAIVNHHQKVNLDSEVGKPVHPRGQSVPIILPEPEPGAQVWLLQSCPLGVGRPVPQPLPCSPGSLQPPVLGQASPNHILILEPSQASPWASLGLRTQLISCAVSRLGPNTAPLSREQLKIPMLLPWTHMQGKERAKSGLQSLKEQQLL